jgi:hypothetical protein
LAFHQVQAPLTVGLGRGRGTAPRAVTASTLIPPAPEQRAENASGTEFHTVVDVGCGRPSIAMPAAISVPGANGIEGKIESTSPWLRLSRAGLVHSTCLSCPAGTRPKNCPPGCLIEGRERNHTSKLARRTAGGYVLEVPANIRAAPHQDVAAQDERGHEAAAEHGIGIDPLFHQLVQQERALRMVDQHEAAPVVVIAQIFPKRGQDVVVREWRAAGDSPPLRSRNGTVTCRYIGANTRQYWEYRATWNSATDRSSGSMLRLACSVRWSETVGYT